MAEEIKTPEQIAEEVNKNIVGFKEQLNKAATKEDLNAIKTQLDALPKSEAITKLQKDVTEALEEVAQMKEKSFGGKEQVKTFAEEFVSVIDHIKGLVKGSRNKEVVIKANTTRTSITGNTQSLHLPNIGQLGVKVRGLYNIFPKLPVSKGDHNGKVTYIDWDEDTIVRAADMVAEGGTFPESTAKFQQYEELLKKIGDTLPVSEEFGEDAPTAAAELEMFIDTNVETKIDSELVVADGTGQRIKGIMTLAPAYTPAASSIADANIYDLVKKVRTDITKDRGSKYQPDFAAMNSDTIDLLHLKKDANNNYIFPDKQNIGNIIIVEDNNIPANQMVVGDRRYGRIYEMGGVELTRGLKGDQFVEDMETIKARKRLLFLIRNVDKTGFRKVTDVAAALVTLAS
ncbi:MAG: phage major capsid protein [Flavobacteriaceae bacterium]